MDNPKVELTIKINPYTLAMLIDTEHQFLPEWNQSEQYEVLNAIRSAVNEADPQTKATLATLFQDGIYHQSDSGKWRGKDKILQPVEELEDPL